VRISGFKIFFRFFLEKNLGKNSGEICGEKFWGNLRGKIFAGKTGRKKSGGKLGKNFAKKVVGFFLENCGKS